MLLIPALVSVLILALSMLLFVNLFYKQAMDETVHGENTVYLEHLLVKQAEEFLQTDHKVLTDSHLYQTVEKYVQTQSIQLQMPWFVPWATGTKIWRKCRCICFPTAMCMSNRSP